MRLLLRWPLRVTEEPLLMTLDQLQQLVAEGESERLEFKKSTDKLCVDSYSQAAKNDAE